MNSKHTPGPWCVRGSRTVDTHTPLQHPQTIWAVLPDGDPAGLLIAQLVRPSEIKGRGLSAEELNANARLIAEAPAMLGLLQRIGVTVDPDFDEERLALLARIESQD